MNLIRFSLFVPVILACTSCNNLQKEDVSPGIAEANWTETAFLPASASETGDVDKSPLKIRLAVNDTYCKDTACECVHKVAARTYSDLQAGLNEKFNIELVLEYFIEPYDLEKRLSSGGVDGVICKPWLAFMLVPKYGMKYKRIADILDPDNKQFLVGIFIVKKDSPVKMLSDLKGKSLVTGDYYSYEKYFSALRMLNQLSVNPGRTYTKASCIESIGELMDGKADAAVISDYAMTADCAVDIAKPEDFRPIASTGKSPLTSVILDFGKISEKDALRLQRALISLSGENTPKTFLGRGFVPPAPWIPDTKRKQ